MAVRSIATRAATNNRTKAEESYMRLRRCSNRALAAALVMVGACSSGGTHIATGAGGTQATGGTAATGGTTGTGGAIGTGGTASTGGVTGTGGTTGIGGQPGAGGTTASGGRVGTDGSLGTGGSVASGGGAGTGGASGNGALDTSLDVLTASSANGNIYVREKDSVTLNSVTANFDHGVVGRSVGN